jgi:hypothetical protein
MAHGGLHVRYQVAHGRQDDGWHGCTRRSGGLACCNTEPRVATLGQTHAAKRLLNSSSSCLDGGVRTARLPHKPNGNATSAVSLRAVAAAFRPHARNRAQRATDSRHCTAADRAACAAACAHRSLPMADAIAARYSGAGAGFRVSQHAGAGGAVRALPAVRRARIAAAERRIVPNLCKRKSGPQCGTECGRSGTHVWHGMAWHGMAWHGVAWFGKMWCWCWYDMAATCCRFCPR